MKKLPQNKNMSDVSKWIVVVGQSLSFPSHPFLIPFSSISHPFLIACIVFAYEFKTTRPIWNALKLQPVLSDEVQCFKALVLLHKLTTGGPKITLQEAIEESSFFDHCARYSNFGSSYSPVIQAYVKYLLQKLEFHKSHPAFTGAFDFEEYQSLKRVNDPNEGYLVISDLMDLQKKLDAFQKTVFSNFRPSHHNECKISSLVPIIEESYGMFKFQTSMLRAMFKSLDDSVEILLPLQEQYITHFRNLKKFYEECSNIK